VIERFAGRYALLKSLGSGGMGEVFLARDLTTGQECALKRLRAETLLAASDLARREFEAITRVRHPAVVSVFEMGFAPDGAPYFTMEYVPGLPADRALARGDWPSFFFIAAQIAQGLEAVHAANVVHGDLKPSNVLVIPGPSPGAPPLGVRLLDFGLSAVLGRDEAGHRGTPRYVAPEVVRGAVPSQPLAAVLAVAIGDFELGLSKVGFFAANQGSAGAVSGESPHGAAGDGVAHGENEGEQREY
jgi:serine/threonine-protein kinase